MRKILYIALLFILVISLGCKEEFLIQSNSYNQTLVVDGFITNEIPPYIIRLYLSSPVNYVGKVPYENCTVTLFENNTKSEIFTETEPGVYKTSNGGIKGVVGNEYHILVETPIGKNYMTESQVMKSPIEIDTIYGELIYKEDLNYAFGLPGYQFYVDTKIAPSQESYLLWNIIETYQYSNDFELKYTFDGRYEFLYMNLGQLPYYENLFRCWNTQNAGYIITGNTSKLTIPKVSRQPLYFVGTDTKRLQERYSLNLFQYSIDEDAYSFWQSIEKQVSQENFLITSQPYTIIGNLKNIDIPDEPVYGYFTVASVTQKRIFVDRPNTPFYYDKCAILKKAPYLPPWFYASDKDGHVGIVLESCIDCTSKGGEPVKPDFWIDK